MAKERMINTKFWMDGYISNLDPIEKLLYLYLLTNPSTTIAGVYEIPIKTIAVDTGIDKEMVLKILLRFEENGKLKYQNGWVVIKNFTKHQKKENPKISKGIDLILQASPDWVIPYIYPIHRASHSNTNINTNINIISDETSSSKDIPLVIKAFETINPASKKFYGNKTQRQACQDLIDTYGLERIIQIIEKTLPKTNTIAYFPSIISPLQLRDKFASLENAINKYQSKENIDQKKTGPVYW